MTLLVAAFTRLRSRWPRSPRAPLLASLLTALLLTGGHPACAAEADFLPPEQAFALQVRQVDTHTLELRWTIAPGYHLYRERLSVEPQAAGLALGELNLPPGLPEFDANFGHDMEVYRNSLVVKVPLRAVPATAHLEVNSQGCADQGLCYPPQLQTVDLHGDAAGLTQVSLRDTPATAGDAAAPATPAAPAAQSPAAVQAVANAPSTVSGGAVDQALHSGHLLSVAGVFLLAGLLLAFTPCVLPMVPILSSIIVGQGGTPSRARGLAMSLAYSLGMALVYTLMGVAAGLMGEGLAAYLQNAWVLSAFALLLVGLSLSMFGFYELQMPAALQSRLMGASNRLPGGQLVGVLAMGGLSALIVGPCVAAPLASALVYIGQTRDVLLGGVALFSLAMGMSVPLLLVGVSAGTLLPRAGGWMETVKHSFGVLLLAVALWMVSPVLPVWAAMLGWALLALGSAVALHAFDRLPDGAGGLRRLGKSLGVVMALVGGAQMLGLLSGGRDVLQPLAHLATARQAGSAGLGVAAAAEPTATVFKPVRSEVELEQALAQAGRPVMLDFYADWCTSCLEMERQTFPHPEVRAQLARLQPLRVDVTANTAQDRALLKRFGLFGPPGIVFFDARGRELSDARVIGYQDASDFSHQLRQVLQ
jgi:thiol:disulfide interchange protein DsbD